MALTEIRADRVLGRKDYPSLEVVYEGGARRLLDVPFAKGAPEAPISDRELEAKARSLLEPVIGAAGARELIAGIDSLEQCTDVTAVLRLTAA